MKFNFDDVENIFKKNTKKFLTEERINEIKKYYPELINWKNNSIDKLWVEYSSAIYMTKNPLWIKYREEALLAYIYVRKVYPDFNFGKEGMFEDYLKNFTYHKPWVNKVEKPKWINYTFLTD